MGCQRSQIYEEELQRADPQVSTEIDNLISESRFMRKEELIDIFTETFHRIRSQGPPDTKQHILGPIQLSRDGKVLHISNQKLIKRRQQYTQPLQNDLDPRDKQLIIPFHFTIDISRFQAYIQGQQERYSNMIKQSTQTTKMKMIGEYMETIKFTNSQEYEQMMSEIQDFLSNMCENVASVTFRLLNEGKLTDNEAKAFASKNFLVNIHALMLEIKNAVKHFAKQEEVQDIIAKITTEVDESMMRVLQSIISHYPMAPAAGETARMREAIINVNRSEDESNDLILNRDIRIEKHLRLNYGEIVNGYENYTGFIMEVINSAINVTREYFSKQEDVSVFERFVQFSERLFSTSQHKYCREVLRKDTKHDERNDKLVDYYLKVLDGEEIEVRDTKEIPKDRKKMTASESLNVIKAEYDEGLEKLRESHRYAVAQKIPTYVMPFSRNQLRGEKFAVGSSSILRIMTKWAQNLQEIFKKPQLLIQQRLHNYKSITNELFAPTDAMNRTLTERVAAQYQAVKGELAKLKTQNTLLQSYILSHNETGIDSYLKRFTQVRSASSQINASLIEIMHKYLCVLIHHLLKAGEKIDTGSGWENINLVVFKVNDLLRSKFQCNESTFINVLNTLALLDRSREMEGRFRLVRLKNKLNEKDNNILINYMFLGRVQCELQLSVQETKGKAKNYYDFNHFLYELIRGKFGAITECAIIVSQHDSTVNSCRDDYYRPKKYQRRLPPKRTYDEQNGIQFKKVHQKDSSLFICSKCKQLMVNHNVELFNCKESICNQCLMAMDDPQLKLKNEKIRHYLHENLGKGVKKIKKYSQIQKDKYVLTLSSNGRNRDAIKLFRVWQHQKQCKVFLLQITKDILDQFTSPTFQYEQFNYVDIKPLQQKKASLKDLTYVFGSETLAEMFAVHAIQEEGLARMQELVDCFEDFRVEKNLVEAIKSKQEILDLSADPKKLRKFQQLLQDEINKDQDGGGEQNLNTTAKGTCLIKYTKYKNLEYNNLKKLHLTQLDLERLPPNLNLLTQLTEISLEANKFTEIDLTIFPKLKKINLNHNQLQTVDFSGLTRLSHIRLNDNQLTNVDLTAHPAVLSELCLQENQISEVAFRFNPKLECSLDNQRSEKCQVSVRFKSNEHALCQQFNEALGRELLAEEKNRNNCEYSFAMQEHV